MACPRSAKRRWKKTTVAYIEAVSPIREWLPAWSGITSRRLDKWLMYVLGEGRAASMRGSRGCLALVALLGAGRGQ